MIVHGRIIHAWLSEEIQSDSSSLEWYLEHLLGEISADVNFWIGWTL